MQIFRWQNCYADVCTTQHGITVQSYFNDVVRPALLTLEKKIDALSHSDEPGDIFACADLKPVFQATKMAFALSIQSIWERQFRGYLCGCATYLRISDVSVTQVEAANWKKLRELFLKLRGISLEVFPSSFELDTLQLVGNACRHGDGDSAKDLAIRCPEFWPTDSSMSGIETSSPPAAHLVEMMDIPIERLQAFVEAIVAFWGDTEFIYKESIERKHPSLEAELECERAKRPWLRRASFNGAT